MTTEPNQTKPVQPIPAAQVSGATSPTPGTEIKSTSTATPIVPRPIEPHTQPTVADDKQAALVAKPNEPTAAAKVVAKVTEKVLAAAEAPAPAVAKPGPSLGDLLERFVSVEKLTDPSSHFTHRGVCTKCGWQTYQLSDSDARQLLRTHVGAHWRDVSTELAR